MATNRFVFGEHAVPNNLAARVSPKSSAVRRVRESVIKTDGPSAKHCAPIPRPAGTSTTIHYANVKAAEQHKFKAQRAKSMPSGIQPKHLGSHSSLQAAYMIACTSNNETVHPDPLVLKQLENGVLTIDMMLYEDGDMGAVARLLRSRTASKELEGIVVSCGEIRGAKSTMKRVGWETSDLPRSVLVGGPVSPSKVSLFTVAVFTPQLRYLPFSLPAGEAEGNQGEGQGPHQGHMLDTEEGGGSHPPGIHRNQHDCLGNQAPRRGR